MESAGLCTVALQPLIGDEERVIESATRRPSLQPKLSSIPPISLLSSTDLAVQGYSPALLDRTLEL